MLAPNPKLSSDHPDRARDAHRARVAECQPLLDKSLALGVPLVSAGECAAIQRYYRAKARRGDYSQYFLHQVKTFQGRISDLGKKKN